MNQRKDDAPQPGIAGQPMTGRFSTFSTLSVGDIVTFELIADRISGARGTRVRKAATAGTALCQASNVTDGPSRG